MNVFLVWFLPSSLVGLEWLQNNKIQGKSGLLTSSFKIFRLYIEISADTKLEKASDLKITNDTLHCKESHRPCRNW